MSYLPPERLAHVAALQRAQSAESLDILTWFLRGQDFAEAWSHYEQQPSLSGGYDLYVRRPLMA